MDLSNEDLLKVNEFRKNKEYIDKGAAKLRLGSPLEKSLLKFPFFHEFEYGANKEGYWNYELMVLQLEDCVDVVKTLYPQYDFLFLFDHSCGQDKQREDGLNVNVMSKLYGGKQRILRTSKIKTHLGFLGKYPRTLNPGDTQKMVISDGNPIPFWMSPEEHIS